MFKFEEANLFGKDAMDSVLKSYSVATKGLQAIAAEAADYSKKSYEAGLAHFEKLVAARSVETIFELQTNFAKTSIEGYIAELTKLSDMYQNVAKDAYQPVEATAQKSAAAVKANVDKAVEKTTAPAAA